jgi:hypothetical protein
MVEGVTGVGKSAAAEYIADCLDRRGLSAEWFEENDYEHPADYTFHAYMQNEQIKELSQEEQIQLYAEGTEVLSGLVIPLTQISVSLFEKVLPYKIYEKLDWETEKPVMLDRWLTFSRKAMAIGQIFVFEGAFLQNPVCEALVRVDLEQPEIKAYITDVYRSVTALRPVVIYLKCGDIKTCVEETGCQRSVSWLAKTIDNYMSLPFARNRGLTGRDGYVACLECRQELELEILESLPCTKLIITDPLRNWEETKQSINLLLEKLF